MGPIHTAQPALYAAFDRFPAAKGAATHIRHAAASLAAAYGSTWLTVLGSPTLPQFQQEGPITIWRWNAQAATNMLDRAAAYSGWLEGIVRHIGPCLQVTQFRDPWSGIAILRASERHTRHIYEINGLPSIELSERYPWLAPATQAKLRTLEQYCWQHAAAIVTPGHTLAANLIDLGVAADKIHVIPNGAALPTVRPRPPAAPPRYLLYFGALQPWQGVDTLLRAFALLQDSADLQLVVIAATSPRHARRLQRLAEQLGIAAQIHWLFQLERQELLAWLQHALASVAPLRECARNIEQGACPLKILESLASAVPVVAADLPSVREVMQDGRHGYLVRPDRPAELSRALRRLLEEPEQARQMGAQGRDWIAEHFTWSLAERRSQTLYRQLQNSPTLA